MVKKLLPALLASFVIVAGASAAEPLRGFDFSYQINDSGSLGVVQAFDDGERIYIQVDSAMDKPVTVWRSDRGGSKALAKVEARKPYLVVNGLADEITIKVGGKQSDITYLGKKSAPRELKQVAAAPAPRGSAETAATVSTRTEAKDVPAEVATATSKPVPKATANAPKAEVPRASADRSPVPATMVNVPFAETSTTIPLATQDQIMAVIGDKVKTSYFLVRGRPSVNGDAQVAQSRALALRNFLTASGVPTDRVAMESEATARPGKQSGNFFSDVVVSDRPIITASTNIDRDPTVRIPAQTGGTLTIRVGERVSEGLAALAAREGWQLVWDASELIAQADVSVTGNFEESVSVLMNALNAGGSMVKAIFYGTNRVLRVTEKR